MHLAYTDTNEKPALRVELLAFPVHTRGFSATSRVFTDVIVNAAHQPNDGHNAMVQKSVQWCPIELGEQAES
jgi:hypothetical protein